MAAEFNWDQVILCLNRRLALVSPGAAPHLAFFVRQFVPTDLLLMLTNRFTV